MQRRNTGLGFWQQAVAAGSQILSTIQQNKALKTQVKSGKLALKTVQEQRAAALETGAQQLQRDKFKIAAIGIGGLAALGVAYFAFNRGKRS